VPLRRSRTRTVGGVGSRAHRPPRPEGQCAPPDGVNRTVGSGLQSTLPPRPEGGSSLPDGVNRTVGGVGSRAHCPPRPEGGSVPLPTESIGRWEWASQHTAPEARGGSVPLPTESMGRWGSGLQRHTAPEAEGQCAPPTESIGRGGSGLQSTPRGEGGSVPSRRSQSDGGVGVQSTLAPRPRGECAPPPGPGDGLGLQPGARALPSRLSPPGTPFPLPRCGPLGFGGDSPQGVPGCPPRALTPPGCPRGPFCCSFLRVLANAASPRASPSLPLSSLEQIRAKGLSPPSKR